MQQSSEELDPLLELLAQYGPVPPVTIPPEYICPLSQKLMADPVIVVSIDSEGHQHQHVFERVEIFGISTRTMTDDVQYRAIQKKTINDLANSNSKVMIIIPIKLEGTNLAVVAIQFSNHQIKKLQYFKGTRKQSGLVRHVDLLEQTLDHKMTIIESNRCTADQDQSPYLVEVLFHEAESFAGIDTSKMIKSQLEIQKIHIRLACQNGQQAMYFEQFMLKGSKALSGLSIWQNAMSHNTETNQSQRLENRLVSDDVCSPK